MLFGTPEATRNTVFRLTKACLQEKIDPAVFRAACGGLRIGVDLWRLEQMTELEARLTALEDAMRNRR